MSVNYSIEERYQCVVVTLKGSLMGGPEAQDFKDDIKKLIDEDKKNVVADLSRVKFMNSSGLGILISALTTLRNAGGDLKISGASEKIESLLMVTKLITVFDHHKTLDEAIAAYS